MEWLDVAAWNQLDGRWKDTKLGTCVDATIGTDGCLMSCFGMIGRATPDVVAGMFGEKGLFYAGCCAGTFDARKAGLSLAPALVGVTGYYEKVEFPTGELERVWNHIRAGGVGIACVDFDPKTARFDQHWIVLAKAFGSAGYADFVIKDPWGGVECAFTKRYGNLARALVRVALYSFEGATRVLGERGVEVEARQEKRAVAPIRAQRTVTGAG